MTMEVNHHIFAPSDHRFDIRCDDLAESRRLVNWVNERNGWWQSDELSGWHLIEVRWTDARQAMLFKLTFGGNV